MIEPDCNHELLKPDSPSVARWQTYVVVVLLFVSMSLLAVPTFAASTIFLVRHAERADSGGSVSSDPGLSAEGNMRAVHLAQELKDAKITAIFTSEFQRTQETAAPLAKSLGIHPEIVLGKDVSSLIARIRATSGNVLVVAHSNTLPQIVKALGISTPVIMTEADYDNLFVVLAGEAPRLIWLHYR
jgi:broad specificity phosphatase PhoE